MRKMLTAWEYTHFEVWWQTDTQRQAGMDDLARAGAHGWEAVGISPLMYRSVPMASAESVGFVVLLKRPAGVVQGTPTERLPREKVPLGERGDDLTDDQLRERLAAGGERTDGERDALIARFRFMTGYNYVPRSE